MTKGRTITTISPTRIAGSYLFFGVLWILLSDRFVTFAVTSQFPASRLQTIKGWLFVLVSALLIFGLTHTRKRQIETSRERLNYANQKLQVLHRIFRHNIRNDLNVILGNIDMVRANLREDRDEERLESAARSASQILDMSDKLRVIERLDLHPSIDETIDLAGLVRRECDYAQSAYPDVTIETDLPDRAPIYGGHSLVYVVREVLQNAIGHHDRPIERLRITVTLQQTATGVELQISDNGPGIPEYEIEALRTEEETQLVHVSGVGLWLITWLCRIYDGDAAFESGPAEGTVVTLNFQPVSAIEQFTEVALSEVKA